MGYRLEEISPEEGAKLTAELQEVLKKYNAEMGVKSAIELFKRVEISEPGIVIAENEGIISPIQLKDLNGGEQPNNQT